MRLRGVSCRITGGSLAARLDQRAVRAGVRLAAFFCSVRALGRWLRLPLSRQSQCRAWPASAEPRQSHEVTCLVRQEAQNFDHDSHAATHITVYGGAAAAAATTHMQRTPAWTVLLAEPDHIPEALPAPPLSCMGPLARVSNLPCVLPHPAHPATGGMAKARAASLPPHPTPTLTH